MTYHSNEPEYPDPDSADPVDRALFGWSPARLAADSRTKRWVDRILPATGAAVIAYFSAIVGLVAISAFLPTRPGLIMIAIAALGGSLWCSANFWRCRHAHCLFTGAGWLLLSVFAGVEATLGRSFIAGTEPIGFLAVFGASLAFERTGWRAADPTPSAPAPDPPPATVHPRRALHRPGAGTVGHLQP